MGLHWPVIYLARWLVRSWPKLFEEQQWPLPGWYRNARDVCNGLDNRLLEIEDALEHSGGNEDDPDAFAEVRDAFVSTHALAAGAAGGLLPDLYFARDGGRVSIAMGGGKSHPNTWFPFLERGERDVPVALFVDAVRGVVGWVLERIGTIEHPVCNEDRAELRDWLEKLDSPLAAEAALLGYVGIDEARLHETCKTLAGEPIVDDVPYDELSEVLLNPFESPAAAPSGTAG